MRVRVVAAEQRKWWTLGAVAFALFMIMLDNTVVNVALPSIQRDLGIGLSQLEWTVNAYVLTFAVLLLMGGRLADLVGRRRVFLLGLLVFSVSSLLAGLAVSGGALVGWRAVQGVGAALMLPATLSIISATFEERERGLAIGIWVGVSAMALALGPLVGGVFAEQVSWHWIFFLNVPIGVLGLVVGRLVIRESRDSSVVRRLDLPGLVLSAGALFALTFALIEGNHLGWGSWPVLGLFGGAAVGFVLFVVVERFQRAPMLDLGLLRSATFAGANVVAMLVTLAMFGVFFFMSLFLQQILGYSPVRAGAMFLPMTVLIIVVAPIAGKLSDRVGARWLMTGGMTLVAGSLLVFSRLGVGSGFWDLFPGLVTGGLGMAITMTPMTAAALGAVPVDRAGVASGVLTSSRQVGGAVGIAVMGAILSSRSAAALTAGATRPEAFLEGFSLALEVAAAVALVAALVAAVAIRDGRDRELKEAELAEPAEAVT